MGSEMCIRDRVSTQHNLLFAELLRQIVVQGKKVGYDEEATREVESALATLNAGIEKGLLDPVRSLHFREGVADNRTPIDVQALGSLYLLSKNNGPRARAVGEFASSSSWYLADQRTPYGPITGQRPFLDAGSPDLVWTEGTIETRFAFGRLGFQNARLDGAIASFRKTIAPGTVGPVGASADSDTIWGQYRPWPTSSAASWLLMVDRSKNVPLWVG